MQYPVPEFIQYWYEQGLITPVPHETLVHRLHLDVIERFWNKFRDAMEDLALAVYSGISKIVHEACKWINEHIVKPINEWIDRQLEKFKKKTPDLMMVTIGVPMTWKALESFVTNPSRKGLLGAILAPFLSWIVSKTLYYTVSTRMLKAKLPEVPVPPKIEVYRISRSEALLRSEVTLYKPKPNMLYENMFKETVTLKKTPSTRPEESMLTESCSIIIRHPSMYRESLVSDSIEYTVTMIPVTSAEDALATDTVDVQITRQYPTTYYSHSDALLRETVTTTITTRQPFTGTVTDTMTDEVNTKTTTLNDNISDSIDYSLG